MGLNPKGRDWGDLVNWDDLGKAYAGLVIAWSGFLVIGIAWLIRHRNESYIKIRNLPLAVAATVFLHIYLVKICLAYTTNGHFLCSAEFWVMSIYLPFGIALFQANLAQLSSISDQQRQLLSASEKAFFGRSQSTIMTGMSGKWHRLTKIQRTYCYISLGMAVQLALTLSLFLTSPTLQGDWKVYGNVPHSKGQGLCRKSLHWIPSAFWQLFWSWIYGPYLLFSIRKINDTHYWRPQVIISVISGLPGSPLWLAALFSPSFKPVNKWFVPPMWLAPGIVVMQACTIFFPMYEAYTSQQDAHRVAQQITVWKQQAKASPQTLSTEHESIIDTSCNATPRHMELYTMSSLERTLAEDPIPLLRFAATQDFSAENIIFLMHLRRWRTAWQTAPRDMSSKSGVTCEALEQLFSFGVEIYVSSVHLQTNDFPINIESRIRTALDSLFAAAASDVRRSTSDTRSQVTSLPDEQFGTLSAVSETRGMLITERAITEYEDEKVGTVSTYALSTYWSTTPTKPTTATTTSGKTMSIQSVGDDIPIFEPHPCVRPFGTDKSNVPDEFDERVFDDAERSIKYLVLTNTWQKFVRERLKHSKEGGLGFSV